MSVLTGSTPAQLAGKTLVTRENDEIFTGLKTFAANPVFNDGAIAWPKVDKTGAALSDFPGTLSFLQMPNGSGTWAASPVISGTLHIGQDVIPAVPNSGSVGLEDQRFDKLFANELHVATLIKKTIATSDTGNIFIPKNTTKLAFDLDIADTIATIEDNNLADGDNIFLQKEGVTEKLVITSPPVGTGPYNYNVTRGVAANWKQGDAIVNTGQIGDGIIEILSTSGVFGGVGPSIISRVRDGVLPDDLPLAWIIGNLKNQLDYITDIFGAIFMGADGSYLSVDPLNGVRITDADIILGAGDVGYNSRSAYKFVRPGVAAPLDPLDIFALYNYAIAPGESTLALSNVAIPGPTSTDYNDNLASSVYLTSRGWDGTAHAGTEEVKLELLSRRNADGGSSIIASGNIVLSAGAISSSYQPQCSASNDVLQSAADNTDVALSLPDEDFDISVIAGSLHDNVTNNSRITIPVTLADGRKYNTAGVYLIIGAVYLGFTEAATAYLFIRKNGTTKIAVNTVEKTAGIGRAIQVSCLASLVAGDYVELIINQISGAARNIGSAADGYETRLQLIKLW